MLELAQGMRGLELAEGMRGLESDMEREGISGLCRQAGVLGVLDSRTNRGSSCCTASRGPACRPSGERALCIRDMRLSREAPVGSGETSEEGETSGEDTSDACVCAEGLSAAIGTAHDVLCTMTST